MQRGRSSHYGAAPRLSRERALRRDEIEDQRRPAEARRTLALRGAWVVELADAALRLHRDGAARELVRDVGEAVLPQAPVEVPVRVEPRRSAPGGLRAPTRIEARLARGGEIGRASCRER